MKKKMECMGPLFIDNFFLVCAGKWVYKRVERERKKNRIKEIIRCRWEDRIIEQSQDRKNVELKNTQSCFPTSSGPRLEQERHDCVLFCVGV